MAVEEDIVGNRALGGASIVASTPHYVFPMVFKKDIYGEPISSPGIEYYDNSVPFDGVYPTYVQQLVEISNGDIKNITLKHHSKAADIVHPSSSFTAAVQDVQDGLVDLAIGPFWITGE